MKKFSVILILLIVFQVVAATDENFSLILFPDTQNEVKSHKDMWESMPQWVVANQAKLNIKAVIGLGDVTDAGTPDEYVEAVKGWNVIKSSGLIYMPTRGNNGDMYPIWNQYFGPNYFAGKAWFGGSYGNSTSCYYVKFVEGSQNYLILAVGFDPNTQQIAWAQSVLNANKDSKVVVVAHSYLDVTQLTPEGTKLWNGLIMQNKNIFLVVCGHVHNPSPPTSYFVRDKVNELRADYQDSNSGNGYMEILTFQPSKCSIQTTSFSAYINNTDPKGSYVMPKCVSIPFPRPRLVYNGREDGTIYTRYNLLVTNRDDYPANLFRPAPDLAPCGLNKKSSRTWVNIYDQKGNYIYGFCALSKPSDMDRLWFAIAKGKVPPKGVYITLYDRACNISSKSNLVAIK
jgi:hypothetical protein